MLHVRETRRQGTLVGRARELQLLAELIADVSRGRGRLLVIEGEAGSGKTTLLDEAVRLANGFTVFRGAAHDIDLDRPFGLIFDALGISLSAGDAERSSIAQQLRVGPAGIGDVLRYRVVEDIVALVEREALARPVLLALDDLQWADEPSLLALHHLARSAAHLPILIVLARRPRRPAGRLEPLDELARADVAETIDVNPLDPDEVTELATRILGFAPSAGLRQLLARAGGNPFFVTELLVALREDGSIDALGPEIDTAITEIRPELRMVILRRLGGLAPATVRALRMASIVGTPFTARHMAVVLGEPATELVDPLEEAISAGVLRAQGDRLEFRHDLIREALYADVPAPIRNALHLEVARALRRTGAPPTQCAPHFAIGAAFGDEDAIDCLRQAAADIVVTEPKAAKRWLSRAKELVGATDERQDAIVAETCAVMLRLGEAEAVELMARDTLRKPQPRDRRVALKLAIAQSLDQRDRCLDAAAIYNAESRAEDLDRIERLRLAAHAVELQAHVGAPEAEAAGRDILRLAELEGDAEAVRWVLIALLHLANWRGDFDEAVRLAERSLATAAASDPFAHSGGLLGEALAGAGRTREAFESLRADVRAAEAMRDTSPMSHVLYQLASLEAGTGRWDEAISNAEAAIGVAVDTEQKVRHDEAVGLLAALLIRRNELDRAAELFGSLRGPRWFVSALAQQMLAEATGEPERALRVLRDAWELATATGRHSDLPTYAANLVRLELAVGDRARAADVTRSAEELAAKGDIAWITVAALRCRGLLDADAVALLQAAEISRDAELHDLRASALEEAGVVLARAGRAKEALTPLQDALAYAESVGAAYDQLRLEAALRGLGVRRGRRGVRPRARRGWESLTETEGRVVDLAAEGLTNSEIGARLFISGRTVERHLTHVYSKLGVGSRVELAARVAAERVRR